MYLYRNGEIISVDVSEHSNPKGDITCVLTMEWLNGEESEKLRGRKNHNDAMRDKIGTLRWREANGHGYYWFEVTQWQYQDSTEAGHGCVGGYNTKGEAIRAAMEYGYTVYNSTELIPVPADLQLKPKSLRATF